MRIRALLLTALGIWLGLGRSSAANSPQGSSSLRYLFLVDSSQSMVEQRETVAKAIAMQVRTGFEGHIAAGELFAIWTCGGNGLSTEQYLPTPWQARTSRLFAERLDRSLRDLPFYGEAHLDKALAEATKFLSASDSLTIVIVCGAGTALVGTPFDDRINAAFREPLDQSGTLAKVYMTTLLTRNAQMIGWSVQPVAEATGKPGKPVDLPTPGLVQQAVSPNAVANLPRPVSPQASNPARGDLPLAKAAPPAQAEPPPHPADTPPQALPSTPPVTAEQLQPKRPVQPAQTISAKPAENKTQAEPDTGSAPLTHLAAQSNPRPESAPAGSSSSSHSNVQQQGLTKDVAGASVLLSPLPPRPQPWPKPDAESLPTAVARPGVAAASTEPAPEGVRSISSPRPTRPPLPPVVEPETEVEAAPVASQTAPAVLVMPKSSSTIYLGAGASLLLAGVFGLLYFLRSRPVASPSSLISQSLDTRKSPHGS